MHGSEGGGTELNRSFLPLSSLPGYWFSSNSTTSHSWPRKVYRRRKTLGEMGSPTSAVSAATPIAAAIAAAPVTTTSIGAAWIVPRGSLAAMVITANEFVAAAVRRCGRFGGWICRGIAVFDAPVAARELVVKPVASESSAKSSEHAREETAAGSTRSATVTWSVTRARPHSG